MRIIYLLMFLAVFSGLMFAEDSVKVYLAKMPYGSQNFSYIADKVTVKMFDAQNNVVLDQKLTSNSYASFEVPYGKKVYFQTNLDGQNYGGFLDAQFNCNVASYFEKSSYGGTYYYGLDKSTGVLAAQSKVNVAILYPNECEQFSFSSIPEPTKNNKFKVTVYAESFSDSSNKLTPVVGATVYAYQLDGKVKFTAVSDNSGNADFNLDESVVYFVALKGGITYSWSNGDPTHASYYYSKADDAVCGNYKSGGSGCTVSGVILYKQPVPEPTKNTNFFYVYLYDSAGNHVSGGYTYVTMYRASDNKEVTTHSANSEGRAAFTADEFPANEKVYFKGKKMNKIYESVDALIFFSNSGDSATGYCQYKNGVQLQCKLNSYALTKETALPEEVTSLNNNISVYVYDTVDGQSLKVSSATIKMYKYSDNSVLDTKVSSGGGFALFTLPTDGTLVYFVATKDEKTFSSYSNSPKEFLLFFNSISNLKCASNNGKNDCSINIHTIWAKKTKDVQPTKPEVGNPEETKIGYSLKLDAGWNLFSLPFNYGNLVSSTCSNDNIFGYDKKNSKYQKVPLPKMTSFPTSFWIKTTQTCTIDFKVDSNYGWLMSGQLNVKLTKGWNFLNAPKDSVLVDAVAGNCQIKSGPWGYNPDSKTWEKSNLMRPGFGYLVKVVDDCDFGPENEMPPPIPSD